MTNPTTNPANATASPPEPRRVFTALKPTGELQLGNYLGAIRPLIDLTADPTNDVTLAVADLHALTVTHDPHTLRERTLSTAAILLACGLPDTTRLFVQSHLPTHTELAYLMECTATYGQMHRMVAFKEKADTQTSVRLSLLTYPTLMSADILAHQAHLVPVGADQRQHLELARDLAVRFNTLYGTVFTVPKPLTSPDTPRLKDLRDPTAKMGKSGAQQEGVISLLDAPDTIRNKVRRAVTDLDRELTYDPANRPGIANLADTLGALTHTTPTQALDGLRGSGDLKNNVTDALIETLGPIQDRYRDIRAEDTALLARMADTAAILRETTQQTIAAAKDAIGLLGP